MYETKRDKNLGKETSKFLFKIIQTLVALSIVGIIIYLFVAAPHEVVGNSMHPTYKNGEYIVGNKLFTNIKRGDVVIYEYNSNVDYIKRIIGLPGETIKLNNSQIYINNQPINENEYLENVPTYGGEFLREGQEITIPANEYFTMGDNRTGSYDSRNFGTIHKDRIKGKAFLVLLPFQDLRAIRTINTY